MDALNRRSFLTASALGMASVPFALSTARAQDAVVPPSEKVRVGLIGCGGISEADLACFLLNPEVDCPIICDVDDAMIARRANQVEGLRGKLPDTVKDFRRVIDRNDVDVVLVCTPDHWHALPTIYACESGKDVYVEKPLGRSIDEGRAMLEAAKKFNRVVQMGTHWRSGAHYRDAVEFVQSGKLGKVRMVRCWAYLDWLGGIGSPPDSAPPDGVDYDMWLGPAPLRPFNKNRFHFNFRWFWDYAGGLMTDWGAHHFDIAQWGLGMDGSGPVEVIPPTPDNPDAKTLTYVYANGVKLYRGAGQINGAGVEFVGTKGRIGVNRGGFLVTEPASLRHETIGPGETRLYNSPDHRLNFLESVRTGREPVCPAEVGCSSAVVCHIGNIAHWLQRPLKWDPAGGVFVDDPEANRLLSRAMRAPWQLA